MKNKRDKLRAGEKRSERAGKEGGPKKKNWTAEGGEGLRVNEWGTIGRDGGGRRKQRS